MKYLSMSKLIYIVSPYGALPGEGWRKFRNQLFAEYLVKNGYKVKWFTSKFDHTNKIFRKNHIKVDGFQIVLVETCSYAKNISFKRIFSELLFGRNLCNEILRHERPDYIIATDPLIFYGGFLKFIINKYDVKPRLIIDCADLWPELFVVAFPLWLKWLSKLPIATLKYYRRHLYKSADFVTLVSEFYSDPLDLKRLKKNYEVIYCSPINHDGITAKINKSFLDLFAAKAEGEVWVVYLGYLGENYDIVNIVNASEFLNDKKRLNFISLESVRSRPY